MTPWWLAPLVAVTPCVAASQTDLATLVLDQMACADATHFEDFSDMASVSDEDWARLQILNDFYRKLAAERGISSDQAAFDVGFVCYQNPDKPLSSLTFD